MEDIVLLDEHKNVSLLAPSSSTDMLDLMFKVLFNYAMVTFQVLWPIPM